MTRVPQIDLEKYAKIAYGVSPHGYLTRLAHNFSKWASRNLFIIMRYFGIDYGTKRVGIARSDEGGLFAFPDTVLSPEEAFVYLVKKAEEMPTEFVIGKSISHDGTVNTVQKMIESFAQRLRDATGQKVHFMNEALTSFEAHAREGKSSNDAREHKKPQEASLDAKAAALVLQRYLEYKQ